MLDVIKVPETLTQTSQELLHTTDSLEHDLDLSLSNLADMRAQNITLGKDLEVKDNQIQKLETNLANKKSEVSSLEQNMARIESERKELTGKVSQLQRQLEDSKEIVEKSNREAGKMGRKVAEMEDRDVRTAAEYNVLMMRLKSEKKDLTCDMEHLRKEIQLVRTANEAMGTVGEVELRQERQKFISLEHRHKNLLHLLSNETDQVEQLTAENRLLQIQLLTLKEKLMIEQRRDRRNFTHEKQISNCSSRSANLSTDTITENENSLNFKPASFSPKKASSILSDIEVDSTKVGTLENQRITQKKAWQTLYVGSDFDCARKASIQAKSRNEAFYTVTGKLTKNFYF